MGFERLIRAYMVLIFAGDCWKRRELLQCQFWSIEFRTILSIFWGWSILISFCFVQVFEHCLRRGEGVGCALPPLGGRVDEEDLVSRDSSVNGTFLYKRDL